MLKISSPQKIPGTRIDVAAPAGPPDEIAKVTDALVRVEKILSDIESGTIPSTGSIANIKKEIDAKIVRDMLAEVGVLLTEAMRATWNASLACAARSVWQSKWVRLRDKQVVTKLLEASQK